MFVINVFFGSFSATAQEINPAERQTISVSDINFDNLIDIERLIFRDPMAVYQRINELESQLESQNGTMQTWWYFRKAQCENLLHLFHAFDQTLSQLSTLISVDVAPALQARYYYFQGISLQRAGLYEQARRQYSRSMEIAKAEKLTEIYIKTKQEYAYTYSLSELYDASLKDIQAAFVEAYAKKDQFLIAVVNETYGAVYSYMNEYERSANYYLKAIDTYERLGYPTHVADAMYALANTYRYGQEYQLAIKFFNLYLQKVSYTPNPDIRFYGVYGVAMTLSEQGNCSEALTHIDEALLLNGPEDFDAELYKQKTSCLIQLNQLDEAEAALTISEDIFTKMPELTGSAWQLENDKLKSQLAYAQGQYKQGYDLLADYHQIYTDNLMKNASERITNIRNAAELERQKIEKALSSERAQIENLQKTAQQQELREHYYFIVFLLVSLFGVIVVVTILYRNNRKMIALYVIDSLTNLYSRRFTFDYLERVLNERKMDKSHLSLLVLDIDDFKSVNDELGHATADEVLKKIAKCTKSAMRPSDVVGRISGEELMCVLPRTDKMQAKAIAERIRTTIKREHIVITQHENNQVTVSIGIATANENNIDAKNLYSLADAALYRAKLSGKNSIEFSA